MEISHLKVRDRARHGRLLQFCCSWFPVDGTFDPFVVRHHEYTKYKVVVYSAAVKAYKFRDKVLKEGGIWKDIYIIDEKKIASMVREDKIDILVELTGHTTNNKLRTMACRPAPIQVTWIGHPNTTGLLTVDYKITDSFADPPDTKQKQVEDLVRLSECFLCYTPSPKAGHVCPTSPFTMALSHLVTEPKMSKKERELDVEDQRGKDLIDVLSSESSGDFMKVVVMWSYDPEERDARLANKVLNEKNKSIEKLKIIIDSLLIC